MVSSTNFFTSTNFNPFNIIRYKDEASSDLFHVSQILHIQHEQRLLIVVKPEHGALINQAFTELNDCYSRCDCNDRCNNGSITGETNFRRAYRILRDNNLISPSLFRQLLGQRSQSASTISDSNLLRTRIVRGEDFILEPTLPNINIEFNLTTAQSKLPSRLGHRSNTPSGRPSVNIDSLFPTTNDPDMLRRLELIRESLLISQFFSSITGTGDESDSDDSSIDSDDASSVSSNDEILEEVKTEPKLSINDEQKYLIKTTLEYPFDDLDGTDLHIALDALILIRKESSLTTDEQKTLQDDNLLDSVEFIRKILYPIILKNR